MVGYKQPSMTVYSRTMRHQQTVPSTMEVTTNHKPSYRIPKKDNRRHADDRIRQAMKELKKLKEMSLQYDLNRRKVDKIIDKLHSS